MTHRSLLSAESPMYAGHMCRSIKPLFNIEPEATDQEVEHAARQFVRKVSGYRTPSKANEAAYEAAIADIAYTTKHLIGHLTTKAKPHRHAHGIA